MVGRRVLGWGTGRLRLRSGVGGSGGAVGVLVDGEADGLAPGVGAEGVDVFVLGEMDGLGESLREVGEGAGGAGFDVAAGDGCEEASECGAQIASGEIVAGGEVVEVAAEFFSGDGLGFFLGVAEAEMGMAGGNRSEAAAAIGEREMTQGRAVLWPDRRHG
jgi:hypothetical protein